MAVDLSGSFDRATLFESIFQMKTYHVQPIFGLLISEIRYSLNILDRRFFLAFISFAQF